MAKLNLEQSKIMLEADKEAFRYHLEEKRFELESLKAGIDAKATEINSGVQLAQIDMEVGKANVDTAMKQQQMYDQATTRLFADLANEAKTQLSQQPQNIQQPPQMMPQAEGAQQAAPEGAPQIQLPEEQQPEAAEEQKMASPQQVEET